MQTTNEIPFLKPFVPPTLDLIKYIERIRKSGQLTNAGEIHAEFEEALCRYLKVEHISLFSSGTLALTIALKALHLKGEVITTPFTSPATLQAIVWNNLTPVFVDIDPFDLNIDPKLIEKAITADTCAILPVHIFGSPCKTDEISAISEKYNIPVIYDAAHCFGVEVDGQSICNFGAMSVLSFHATKVFNTLEGGAVICRDARMKQHIDALKNTGINKKNLLDGYGLNAKMNELQAAYGLSHLQFMDEILISRKVAAETYFDELSNIEGIRFQMVKPEVRRNYPYIPVLIDPAQFGNNRDALFDFLSSRRTQTKKYFYPLVSDFKEFGKFKRDEMPVADWVTRNILCLPMFYDISVDQIREVSSAIKEFQKLHYQPASTQMEPLISG
ncbi:MAG TPA: DegT/DnrJ/EryC1/StrS family aminotransferase [Bacteroidales bacterium]|nr:DegT/DnrJ/EryC1/StrS family aminotransferase [Bacteroidales bacterium]HRX97972.1 DegT/DnrJ/EryC1/StrS family aminotransferase [Bacteroidales bacterium]